MQYKIENTTELAAAATWLMENTPQHKVYLFKGSMGAGKTTFIKAICAYLGVQGTTSSPTFSIVNAYDSPVGEIYHFDFYRLNDEREAYDLGYEEYFFSGNYCFIEWPEKIPHLIPENAVRVEISVMDDLSRVIELTTI